MIAGIQGKVKVIITECLATTFPELFCLSLGNVFALVGRVTVSQHFQLTDLIFRIVFHAQFSLEMIDI